MICQDPPSGYHLKASHYIFAHNNLLESFWLYLDEHDPAIIPHSKPYHWKNSLDGCKISKHPQTQSYQNRPCCQACFFSGLNVKNSIVGLMKRISPGTSLSDCPQDMASRQDATCIPSPNNQLTFLVMLLTYVESSMGYDEWSQSKLVKYPSIMVVYAALKVHMAHARPRVQGYLERK